MKSIPSTESESNYDNLETLSIEQVLSNINSEDHAVPRVINKLIPEIGALVEQIVVRMKVGGRLFYVGAGTSGRLGIVDASECPPTFGVPHDWVIGIMAGGDQAIRKAVEFAEDDSQQGFKDLKEYDINDQDVVIGIAASGTTPYVIGALKACREHGILTGCITCNDNSPLEKEADHPIVAVVGPEVVTGSTRMKAGTAQKLILNMISTTTMIQLGRVEGNKMVDMQLSNNKLVNRGTRMIMDQLNIAEDLAGSLLSKYGSVRAAVQAHRDGETNA
ncbi:MAG: N-acetylmuramic acid 6-phosphate etherase [Flavobacteriales bacterium]|nr:N-acetylmuramic acid 6-phosphate etherase [Flavobacteriales bacterium]